MAPTVSAEMPRLLGKPELAPSARKLRRLDRQERRVWTRAPAYVDDHARARRRARRPIRSAAECVRRAGRRAAADLDDRPRQAPATRRGRRRRRLRRASLSLERRGRLRPRAGARAGVRGLIVGGHPGEADRARVDALIRDARSRRPRHHHRPRPPHDVLEQRLAAPTSWSCRTRRPRSPNATRRR